MLNCVQRRTGHPAASIKKKISVMQHDMPPNFNIGTTGTKASQDGIKSIG
jgi:hypothetical protein